jgi:hypothetical protein
MNFARVNRKDLLCASGILRSPEHFNIAQGMFSGRRFVMPVKTGIQVSSKFRYKPGFRLAPE